MALRTRSFLPWVGGGQGIGWGGTARRAIQLPKKEALRCPWQHSHQHYQWRGLMQASHATALGPAPNAAKAQRLPGVQPVGVAVAAGMLVAAAGVVIAEAPPDHAPDPDPIAGPVQQLDIVLYAYDVCPFCNKLRAYLDYHSIPYRWVEVNPLTKSEMKFSSYRKRPPSDTKLMRVRLDGIQSTKVPLAVINGHEVGDSSKIISLLEPLVQESATKDGAAQPVSNPARDAEDEKWFDWVDSCLVRTLPPNIYRTLGEALRSFDYLAESSNLSWLQRESARVVGGGAMYVVAKRLKKKYDIDDERQALYDAVEEWISAIGETRTFLGGDAPGRADLAVFGVLRSLEKFEVFPDLTQNTRVLPWYTAMQTCVGESARI